MKSINDDAAVGETAAPDQIHTEQQNLIYPDSSTQPQRYQELINLGYLPGLMPIIPSNAQLSPDSKLSPDNLGKIPGVMATPSTWMGLTGWPDLPATTLEQIRQWSLYQPHAVGVRAAYFPAVDIDIDDGAMVGRVYAILKEVLPESVTRWRDGSYRLILSFKLAPGELSQPKRVVHLPDGAGMVEFLGDRNQYVLSGPHKNGAMQTVKGTLAEVTQEQLEQAIALLVKRMGGKLTRSNGSANKGNGAAPVAAEDDKVLQVLLEAGIAGHPNYKGEHPVDCPRMDQHGSKTHPGDSSYHPSHGFHCFHEGCGHPNIFEFYDDVRNQLERDGKTELLAEFNQAVEQQKAYAMFGPPLPVVQGVPPAAPVPKLDQKIQATGQSKMQFLKSLSATHRINKMKQNMANEFFIFPDIALSGQMTLIFGPPNAGKTLLFLHFLTKGIDDGTLKAEDIFYINADDSYQGLLVKAEIAQQYGFSMISPAEASVKPEEVITLLRELAMEGEMTGKIIILDTLKKFTDMMNKRSQADLYATLRDITTKGAAVIFAGHANKHKDADGRWVYEGTGDTASDVDCMYALYPLSEAEDEEQIVEFRREKNRGSNIARVAYSYKKQRGMHYQDIVNSVARVDEQTVENAARLAHEAEMREKYAAEIIFVKTLIASGPQNKSYILQAQKDATVGIGKEISVRKLRDALDKLDGIEWTARRDLDGNNALIYSAMWRQ